MSDPLVSVLIPAYNHEQYVRETIESVIAQTYKNIELIIVDDGSADETYEKICAMRNVCEQRFKRVVFETQKNQGVAITSNKTFSMANGEYLFLLASDDVLEKSAIEKGCRFLQKNQDYVCVLGDNSFINKDSEKCCVDKDKNIVKRVRDSQTAGCDRYKTYCEFSKAVLTPVSSERADYRNMDFVSYDDLMWGHWLPIGAMIRKYDALKALPFSVNTPLEDFYLMLQIVKFGKIKVLKDVFLKYRIHGNNACLNWNKIYLDNITTFAYEIYLTKIKYPIYFRTKYQLHMFEKVRVLYELNEKIANSARYIKHHPDIVNNGWVPIVYMLTQLYKNNKETQKKPNFLEKLMYKIWKWLGKTLQNRKIVLNISYEK